MVRIRLTRVGAKGQPSYRIVAIEKEAPRNSKSLEVLGFYNPRTEPETIQLKEDRIYSWMKNGAQPSESTLKIFTRAGLMDRYERYKSGESLDTLIKEAEAAESARNINSKTTTV
jgi:small subunit ribosomal protein S16